MAIVIPVALEGLRIASQAGVAAQRKVVAAQLAESMLNQTIVTSNWMSSGQSGVFGPQWPGFRYTLKTAPWLQAGLWQLTVEVTYPVQNRECHVRLSTLSPAVMP